MPVTVTCAPPTLAFTLRALGTVSVVMMPSAALSQWAGCASASAAGRPACRRSSGSGSRITPVENGSTCCGRTPSCAASASQVRRAAASPAAPVPALAQPVLMTKARMSAPAPAARCSRHTCTGAAQKRFCVNTPPTLAPSSSSITVKSLRPALRMPASATPMRTPLTGCRLAASGGERWTGMAKTPLLSENREKRAASSHGRRAARYANDSYRPDQASWRASAMASSTRSTA